VISCRTSYGGIHRTDSEADQPKNSVFSPDIVRLSLEADLKENSAKRLGKRTGRSSILTTLPKKLALQEDAKTDCKRRKRHRQEGHVV
jgi:hypothetical protein